MRYTDARLLSDNAKAWPKVLYLQDFTYDTIDNESNIPVSMRLKWLRLGPDYLPQPYEQLAAVYRRFGSESAARRTAIAKHWHQRSQLNVTGKLWNWLLFLMVGYGYRTWQAGLWLLGLLVFGTHIFDAAYPNDMVASKQPGPSFNGVAYTVDILVPILDVGQGSAWQPQGTALYWSWALTAAGWILTTTVVAGLASVLKRD